MSKLPNVKIPVKISEWKPEVINGWVKLSAEEMALNILEIIDYFKTVVVEDHYVESDVFGVVYKYKVKPKEKEETMNNYLGDWSCREDVEQDFATKLSDDTRIIVACYVYESYSGEAIVLFERNNKIYYVEGSHCSCYGLEGQFHETEVTTEFLTHKVENGFWAYFNSGYNSLINKVITDYLQEKGGNSND